jgi:hypothetical protein
MPKGSYIAKSGVILELHSNMWAIKESLCALSCITWKTRLSMVRENTPLIPDLET